MARRLLAMLIAVGPLATGVVPARGDVGVTITNGITSHATVFDDEAATRPRIFAYTGETIAETTLPTTLSTDLTGPTARLRRADLAPNVSPDTPLSWSFAGRGAPVKVNAQDQMPVFLITAARANPYANSWYQRQETARDLWHWGGLFAGSRVSARERSENAIFGRSNRLDHYPDREPGPNTGRLAWDDLHLQRSAVATERDPVTGRDFSGTFWGNAAVPALRVEGGDAVFDRDTLSPPLVLRLPVRPSGLLVYSEPPAPPGVDLDWTYQWDFPAKTLTVTATVKAGSRWPESGAREGDDPSLRYWEWSPSLFFPGWDYGALLNGNPEVLGDLRERLAPATIREDGSLALPQRFGDAGLGALPAGLLDVNLPGGVAVSPSGERFELLQRSPAPPVRPSPRAQGDRARDQEPQPNEATVRLVERDGVVGLSMTLEDTALGELSVPAVTIDGRTTMLTAAKLLDRSVQGAPFGQRTRGSWHVISLYEVDGVFLDVILEVTAGQYGAKGAYYVWDAHSSDDQDHDVSVHTYMNPAVRGAGGDRFVEPFYTGSAYANEAAVPQGVLDFPLGTLAHGWIGSLPAVEARDSQGSGSIRHFQLWPNNQGSGSNENAYRTFGYLMADHGSFQADPLAAVGDREQIDGADVAFDLVNSYRGRIWDRGLLYWVSFFELSP